MIKLLILAGILLHTPPPSASPLPLGPTGPALVQAKGCLLPMTGAG